MGRAFESRRNHSECQAVAYGRLLFLYLEIIWNAASALAVAADLQSAHRCGGFAIQVTWTFLVIRFIGITGKGSPDGFISYTASQPNARSRHVAADEITRERAIRANIRI